MTKHSKNNTASSVFSYAEKQKTQYGTRRQRLGHESMRQFDACSLCLQRAREPVACSQGHLFCKECAFTDLLSQKKDIKRQKAKLEALKQEAEEERARARSEARERVLREFERGQGLAAGLAGLRKESDKSTGDGAAPSKKRKLDFSPTHVEKLAQEAEETALNMIKLEQAESLKHKLPDFWLPSLTPTYASSGPPKDLKDIKVQSVCRGGADAHEISLKTLTPVLFSFTSDTAAGTSENKQDTQAICPSCKKGFSNSTLMFLLNSCSHVVCKTCTDTLVRPSSQCVVCDKEAPARKIVELRREGTGYAGGGLAETSKVGIAFQG